MDAFDDRCDLHAFFQHIGFTQPRSGIQLLIAEYAADPTTEGEWVYDPAEEVRFEYHDIAVPSLRWS